MPDPQIANVESIQGQSQKPFRTSIILATCIAGIIACQMFAGRTATNQQPGEKRGDLVLQKNALPDTIGSWNCIGFEPAPEPNSLPTGQYWWVHIWHFVQGKEAALVTLDQLGLNHWHELTHCYQGNGWILTERTIDSERNGPESIPWEYVTAHFKKASGQEAVLVFSTFYEDGTPADALRIGIDHDWNKSTDFTDRLLGRVNHSNHEKPHSRALQCQVFVPLSPYSSPEIIRAVTELHLVSRVCFRDAWLEHANSPAVADGSQ